MTFQKALLLCADPHLGRVDYSSLSDQTLMEMLLNGFDEDAQKQFQDEHGMYLDVCQWTFVTCDDAENVIKISQIEGTSGVLSLSCIPSKVKRVDLSYDILFDISGKKLTGSIYLEHLPQSTTNLCVSYHHLSGSVDLTQLPRQMEELHLQKNLFTGSVDLTRLPQCMMALYLQQNQFTGSVDWTNLPQSLQHLGLGNNQFTGSVDLSKLPQNMRFIDIDKNFFCGSFIATNLPPNISTIIASGNQFSATAVIAKQRGVHINLMNSGVVAVVDAGGNEKVGGVVSAEGLTNQ